MSGQRWPTHVKRSMPVNSDVPQKRRKLENANNAREDLQRSPVKPISIKRELSPTPPPSLTPRTSGTVRINLPGNCRRDQPGWKARRDRWVAAETLKLRSLGLTVPKRLIRDDGLALDWVSPVPVCPLTLRPPSQVIPKAQITQPPVDLLGHALHDQLLSSGLSSTSGPNSSAHTQVDIPRPNGRESLPQLPDSEARVLSDFTVVGAATLKGREVPASEQAAASSDKTIQWEHRKLLPPDLRPSAQCRYINKETARDRRTRRLVWITKEIEKVEGYTGEKVGGFRYDGDDVIISLSKPVYYARRRNGQARMVPPNTLLPSPSQFHTFNAPPPPPSPRPTRTTYPSGTQENPPEDSHSRAPINMRSGTIAGGTSTVAAVVPIPSSNSMVVKNASSASEPSAPTHVLDRALTLNESTIHDSEAITQARGLGFLERYLQLFDSDRDALSLAYTPNATFCLTEEKYDKDTTITGRLPQINKTGRSAIVETLKNIRPDRHHSPSADITYNIATLDDMSPGGLLLTCEGTLMHVNPTMQKPRHQWCFSRIFVLKQSDEGGRQSWPLQIAAEQLTIKRKMR